MKRLNLTFLRHHHAGLKSVDITDNSTSSSKKHVRAQTIQPEDGYDWLRHIKEYSTYGAHSA